MCWRVVEDLLYPMAFVLADRATTVECLKRGCVELHPWALHPLFPLFQLAFLAASFLAIGELCEKCCLRVGAVGRRLPLLVLQLLLLYPIINNVFLILT